MSESQKGDPSPRRCYKEKQRRKKRDDNRTPSLFSFAVIQEPAIVLLIRKLANYVNANCRLLLRNVIFMDINQ